MLSRAQEGWILAGALDGRPQSPAPLDQVVGMPHLLRLACTLASAGVTRIVVVWNLEAADAPDVAALAADPRLAGRRLELAGAPPSGGDEPVLVVRADRIYHRDLPRLVGAAETERPVVKIAGSEHDAVVRAPRALAGRMAAVAAEPGGLEAVLAAASARGEVEECDGPWLGFTLAAPDRRTLRRAERRLVASLRKLADGFAAQVLNRHVSLWLSYYLARTPIRPNHVTVVCLLAAMIGGLIIARGGYWNGVAGMLLVEIGSILDGVDGELSRLKYQFSRLGQWMDTVTDDLANIFYVGGITLALRDAGVDWAAPLGAAALGAFVITQSIQYVLIAVVYRSGDLAAIPWAFQSAELLSSRPRALWPRLKGMLPRFLKRDFAVTLFLGLALAGRLDLVLVVFSGGAFLFLAVFAVQFVRSRMARPATA